MNSYLHRCPEEQLAVHLRRYQAATAAKRHRALLLVAAIVCAAALSAWGGEVSLQKFIQGLPRFGSYFYDILPKLRLSSLSTDLADWYWNWDGWLRLLAETLLVAYLGTCLGAFGSFIFCFFATGNLLQNAVIRFTTRRTFEFCRTVPDIVFALLFVYALGLGPIPGVLAIGIHTFGALGKQFAESSRIST